MSSVDNRIVNMQFNNKQFQSGAADSVQALEDLESAIAGMGDGSGMEELGRSVDSVGVSFGALQVAGVAALATIASQATQTALSLGRDLLSSITSSIFGAGQARAIAIQQAEFQFRGLGLNVDKVMSNAMEAVDGTAYGLAEAATAATQFGGAGIKAGEDMTGALRAISGIAAQTGRSYSEIAQVMTGIAGVGKLTGQDLIQFGVRGLNVVGPLAEQLNKTQNEIREMVSNGEIDFKTFAKAMDNAFGANATKANRTFTGALANMKAALSRIGGDFFSAQLKPIGNVFNALRDVFDQFREMFKPVSAGLGEISAKLSENLVAWLDTINVARLFGPVLQGFKNIIAPFVAIAQELGQAWVEVFPNKKNSSKKIIFDIAVAFEALTTPLAWIADQIPKISPLFVALFSIFKVGVVAIEGIVNKLGELRAKFFEIGGDIVGGIFEGMNAESIEGEIVKLANNIIEWLKKTLGIASPAAELVPVGEAIVLGIAEGIVNASRYVLESIGTVVGAIVNGFKDMFSGMDATDWALLFNTILTGGVLLAARGFLKTIGSIAENINSTVTTLTKPFDLLTQSLEVMQAQVRADLVRNIAIAVGIMTASIIALSFLDMDKAAQGLTLLAAQMALVGGLMAGLSKVNPASLLQAGISIMLISTAMVALAGALAALALINPDRIAQALTTMAIGLALLVGAVDFLGALGPAALGGAGALFIVANAMIVLAGALAAFSALNPEKVGAALTTMAISLALLVGAVSFLGSLGPAALAGAGGIYIVSASMVVLAGALAVMARIGPKKMSQGLVTITVALGLMSVALAALAYVGPTVITAAGGLFIVAAAMLVLARALEVMGGVGPEKMSQGLTAMAVGLGIFLAAAAIAGVAPVAAGLAVLASSMLVFGAGVALLGVGLLAAATAFSIFVAVFAGGTAVITNGLLALLALLPTFAQQLAVSIVVFIETIAAMAPRLQEAFGKIIAGILGTVRDSIPEMQKLVNALLGALFDVLTKNIPKAAKLFGAIIQAGLREIRRLVPEYVKTGVAIIEAFLHGIGTNARNIIREGTRIVVLVIEGIGNAAEKIATTAGETLLEFLEAMNEWVDKNERRMNEVGRSLAWNIVQGLSFGLLSDESLNMIGSAFEKLAEAGKAAFTGPLGWLIQSPSKVAIYFGEMIVAGLVKGIRDNIGMAVGATIALANAAISAGDKVIRKAQREASKRQIAAQNAIAKANLADKQARQAENLASKSPNNKALEQAAKDARDRADRLAKDAKEAQRKAEAAANKVSEKQEFRSADDVGKGDILTAQAKALSDRAIKKLAEANALAQAAKKASGKERDRLLEEAKREAAIAKRLAKASKQAEREAQKFYRRSVKDRIEAIKAEEQARIDEETFNNSTNEEKIAILQSRAEDAQKRATAAQKQSEALVDRARKVAKTDARRAQRLLDRAEALAEKAREAADEAESAINDAEQLKDQTTGSGSGNTNIRLSTTAMEDAAKAIDRYTQSLQQAEEAAASATPVYQFVQYNNSPESLTEAEVYRQTKNLLSASEIKMGATG